MAEEVRIPVRVRVGRRARAKPSFEERGALRFPRAVGVLRRFLLRLPPGSRLRSAGLARAMAIAFSTYERGDFETIPRVFYADDVMLETAPADNLDLPSPVHGIDGVIHWLEVWHEPFASIRWEPLELYDGGDRFVFCVEQIATGRASGVEVRQVSASAVELEHGFVVRQLATWDLADAIDAAGFELPAGEGSP